MADSSTLLPSLPDPSSVSLVPSLEPAPLSGVPPMRSTPIPPDEGIHHLPVLVPNMRGLENLLNLQGQHEKRLTDEIAVFVAATEVCVTPHEATTTQTRGILESQHERICCQGPWWAPACYPEGPRGGVQSQRIRQLRHDRPIRGDHEPRRSRSRTSLDALESR